MYEQTIAGFDVVIDEAAESIKTFGADDDELRLFHHLCKLRSIFMDAKFRWEQED